MQLNAKLRVWYDEASHPYTLTQCGHFFLVLLEYNFPQVRRQWRAEWTWTPLLPFLCTTFSRCLKQEIMSCFAIHRRFRRIRGNFPMILQFQINPSFPAHPSAKRRECLSWIQSGGLTFGPNLLVRRFKNGRDVDKIKVNRTKQNYDKQWHGHGSFCVFNLMKTQTSKYKNPTIVWNLFSRTLRQCQRFLNSNIYN